MLKQQSEKSDCFRSIQSRKQKLLSIGRGNWWQNYESTQGTQIRMWDCSTPEQEELRWNDEVVSIMALPYKNLEATQSLTLEIQEFKKHPSMLLPPPESKSSSAIALRLWKIHYCDWIAVSGVPSANILHGSPASTRTSCWCCYFKGQKKTKNKNNNTNWKRKNKTKAEQNKNNRPKQLLTYCDR